MMEYDSIESKEQVRQFLESCFEAEGRLKDGGRDHLSSFSGSCGSRLKISDSSSFGRAVHRAGDRSLRVGVGKEKKVRRQIANSNERKRMQSINDGFQSLKALLPQTDTGEKLSKATILQHAANYIAALLDERKRLLDINTQCMLLIGRQSSSSTLAPPPSSGSTNHKRRKSVTESSDEGISLGAGNYKHARSRGRDFHLAESSTSHGASERTGNKRLKKVVEEQQESINLESLYLASQPSVMQAEETKPDSKSSTNGIKLSAAQPEVSEAKITCTEVNEDILEDQLLGHPSSSSECSVSRRNLATIMMAIRHLEGGDFTAETDYDLKPAAIDNDIQVSTDISVHVAQDKEVTESIETCGIKRRWQAKWEKGIQNNNDYSAKNEGVMKLKDRLLRKRQMEMEQQQLQKSPQRDEHCGSSRCEEHMPSKLQRIDPAQRVDSRLLQRLVSNSDDISAVDNGHHSLLMHLQNNTNDVYYEKSINVLNEKLCPATIICGDNAMPLERQDNLFNQISSFYSTDNMLSNFCRPVMLNADVTNFLSQNSVSHCSS